MEIDCDDASSSSGGEFEEVSLVEVFSSDSSSEESCSDYIELSEVHAPRKGKEPLNRVRKVIHVESSSEANESEADESEADYMESSSSEADKSQDSESDCGSADGELEERSSSSDTDYVNSGSSIDEDETEPNSDEDEDPTHPEIPVARWNFDIHDPANFVDLILPAMEAGEAGGCSRSSCPDKDTFDSVKKWQQHAARQTKTSRQPGKWTPRKRSVSMFRHPLTQETIVNERYLINSLQQLHDLCVQTCKQKWDYIRQHNLSWRMLSRDPLVYEQHKKKLFYIRVSEFKYKENGSSLWSHFFLGTTWIFTLKALGICPQAIWMNGDDHDNNAQSYFRCNICSADDRRGCECGDHDQQNNFVLKLIHRDTGRKNLTCSDRDPRRRDTIPKYCRNAHFFRQHPRLLLLCVSMSYFNDYFNTLYSRLMYTCPVLREYSKSIVTGHSQK